MLVIKVSCHISFLFQNAMGTTSNQIVEYNHVQPYEELHARGTAQILDASIP
jgi:hypothetical protein